MAGRVVVSLVLVGCGPQVDGGPETGDSTGGDDTSSDSSSADSSEGGDEGGDVQLPINKAVDILFVIDNSGSMGPVQGNLAASFPAFIDVLEAPDVRASYRIGVTTTDDGNPWCETTSPESGRLQLSSCRGRTGEFVFNGVPPTDATAVACTDHCQFDEIAVQPTTTDFDPEPRPRPWLESSDGVSNLAEVDGVVPTTAEAFQCFGPQGIAGCGFEHHLESMYKAILRSQQEDEAQYGFLRDDAILAVVIVTDEVDCSHATEYESIFYSQEMGGNQVFWSDPDAVSPTSATCWYAGVVCEGGPGIYDTCVSANKDVDGNVGVSNDAAVLHPLSRYVDYLQQLEDDKRQYNPGQELLVSLIAGVPQGYETGMSEIVYADAPTPEEQLDFGIGAGCINNQVDPPRVARPPVREREFAEAFQVGERRNLYSVCGDDYSPALGAIANAIREQIRPSCMPACVADTDPVTAALDPACVLVQSSPSPNGGGIDEWNVPECNADGSVPGGTDVCFQMLVDPAGVQGTPSTDDDMSAACTDEGWNLELRIVRRAGVPAPAGTVIEATCELSQNQAIDCPLLP